MNTLHSIRHEATIPTTASAIMPSMLKLQSAASKATSASFEHYLNTQLNATTPPADGVVRQSPATSQNIGAAVNANTSPGMIASQLLAANQPPANQQLATLTAPLYSPTYMQQFTYNGFVNQANQQNQQSAAVYQLDVNNWALNEAQRQGLGLPSQPPPTAPQYVAVNGLGYNQWWSSLANMGNPAPVNFIDPIPT
jgi:hypothetical protein